MEKSGREETFSTEEVPSPVWLRAIIDVVGEEPRTVGEIEDAVGQLIPSPHQAPVQDYIAILMSENLLRESSRARHYELTETGETLRKGLVRELSA